jgi:hypothetical protein
MLTTRGPPRLHPTPLLVVRAVAFRAPVPVGRSSHTNHPTHFPYFKPCLVSIDPPPPLVGHISQTVSRYRSFFPQNWLNVDRLPHRCFSPTCRSWRIPSMRRSLPDQPCHPSSFGNPHRRSPVCGRHRPPSLARLNGLSPSYTGL